MRRLTYSPRAFIFIRSSNQNGRIYDVSADVVRGEVTQNLGDLSHAEFYLRNRYKKWLRDPQTHMPIFLPMDLVTIWLQRLPGLPIQEFTGYLDAVPYYQGYPGDAPFSASCTLKKLKYTWFDPGVMFFQNWLISQGWRFDPTTGQAINDTLNWDTQKTSKGDIFGNQLNDGSFGKLLRAFITDVGQWDSADVLISDLPPHLPEVASRLYKTIARQSNASLKQLADFYKATMGISVSHDPTNDKSAALKAKLESAASDANIPMIIFAFAGEVMTQLNESYSEGPEDPLRYGYGLFALRPKTASGSSVSGIVPPPLGSFVPDPSTAIDGFSISAVLDAETSCQILANRLKEVAGTLQNLVGHQNDIQQLAKWLAAAVGRDLPKTNLATAWQEAKTFSNTSVVVQPVATPVPAVDPSTMTWATLQNNNVITAAEKKIITQYYQSKEEWLAALVYRLKYFDSDLRLAAPNTEGSLISLDKFSILICGPGDALSKAFDAFASDTTIDHITLIGDPGNNWWAEGTLLVNKGHVSYLTPLQSQPYSAGMVLTQKTKPAVVTSTSPAASGASASGSNPGVSWQQMASFVATSGVAANFAFPTDIIESNLLTGQKALMNDTDCLTAVKQFAAASMRTFRSLPDGRFCAFYPDYFGTQRSPYWSVDNIELTNFGIVLNDEQLATHVYVVGDTIDFNNEIDLIEKIGTTGVATITQATMLQSFIEPFDKNSTNELSHLFDAYNFLEHYGARPYKEEQPIIRNAAFEFLYAWQRFMQKWSQLFSTTVEMTFQPEIMAGGLIKFPDHHVQMFVESVTHHFDYESGFTTSAVMSAPSIPKGTSKIDARKLPGFALAGSVNTVGLAS